MFEFQVKGKLTGHGRAGVLSTPHGDIHTPVFMPVGTQASVKSLSGQDLTSIGAQIILANNYHLFLRPGPASIAKLGGLHKFMGWDKPLLTDSGGFQVHSLAPKISDAGVEFTSHLDGSPHKFTPEIATKSQVQIGADIIMALDVCTPNNLSYADTKRAMDRTHNWLVSCKKAWQANQANQALFGIIQGGKYRDLRRQSAKFVVEQDLPGIAIGGQSIGSDPTETSATISWVKDILPADKPLYAMGVGVKPSDAVAVIAAGADMFDCVAPTRLARCGLLYNLEYPQERLDISKATFKLDKKPIAKDCDCYTCQKFTRAYLHHLFKCRELLFYRLASIHNLRVMINAVNKYA